MMYFISQWNATLILLVCFLISPFSVNADENHSHHDSHHNDNFEWAGVFTTPLDSYNWIAQKSWSGAYADPNMKMAVLPAESPTSFALSSLRMTANAAIGASTYANVTSGGTIQISEVHSSFLQFNDDFYQTVYRMNLSGVSHVAIFTAHFPTEFETTTHFFKDVYGRNIEASSTLVGVGIAHTHVHTHAHGHAHDTCGSAHAHAVHVTVANKENTSGSQWIKALGGACIVWITTLLGVVMMSKSARDHFERQESVMYVFMYAMSAGVLLSTAVYLVLIESSYLIGQGYDKEVDMTWRWGTMVLAGFFTPFATTIFAMLIGGQTFQERFTHDHSMTDIETTTIGVEPKEGGGPHPFDFRLILAIVVADGLHAFVDGVVIGTAFKFCDNRLAWSVTLSSVLHELLQEVSDYFLLTAQGGLSPVKALGCNFLSGIGVIIGALVMMANGTFKFFVLIF